MAMAEFVMPKLGADMTSGRLLEWKKRPGEPVTRGDIIAIVETDKADIEVETFSTGVVEKLLIEPGTKVSVGAVLALIHSDEPEQHAGPVAAPSAVPTPVAAPPSFKPASPQAAGERLRISPAARKLAGELGVDPAAITGTGPDGRIMLEDVERAARQAAEAVHRITPAARKHAEALALDWTALTGSGPGAKITVEDVETAAAARKAEPAERAARMRQAIAAAMTRSKREIPHYYLASTIDMKPAVTWLTETNLKRPVTERLLYGALLLKAAALALRETPELNGFWIEDRAVPSEAIHLGIAISLRGGGLVAPALRHADRLSLEELMAGFRDLVQRARAGGLRGSELTDPTVTVSSLGDQGAESLYGIIYPPQVALVGFGRLVERPWAVNGHLAAHPVITATLAGDHRATDGHSGGRFLAALERLLQEPEKL